MRGTRRVVADEEANGASNGEIPPKAK